ncbi:Rieske (2Fe-2S) protein [Streptomyces sp. NPDC005263]|uniref:Rieske (2Fe-2S) protein n=1 Tax=Streptomyces sp. NPDC005263 TaxID=3364711 RepID=UPI003683E8E4
MTDIPTRRTLLIAAGGAGAAALTAGCGGGEGSSSSNATPGTELARTADIPVGGGKIFKDEGIVVTQPAQGEFKGFSNICTHAQCPVASVSDGTINCTCHGSKFNITDGSVVHDPATRPLPQKKITVRDGSIRLA